MTGRALESVQFAEAWGGGRRKSGNLKEREEKLGREELGFSSSSLLSLQEVPDERNRSGVQARIQPGPRGRGVARGQAAKALNRSPGRLDSTRCEEKPKKGLKQEWIPPSGCCEGNGFECSTEAGSRVRAVGAVVRGRWKGGGGGSGGNGWDRLQNGRLWSEVWGQEEGKEERSKG